MLLQVGDLFEIEEVERHCARVPISRCNVPLVAGEVVFVEQFGALCRDWDQPLSLADVLHDYLTHVGAELFSTQLELFICLQLFFSELGQSRDFFPTQLHLLAFPFNLSFTSLYIISVY